MPAVKIADQEDSIPYRLVGSYEYDRALKLLTGLIAKSTPEEIQVYDQMLQKRAEFSFLNGLALKLKQRPSMAKASSDDRQKFEDKFKKKGLAWMMALAKIELAATKSLYGKEKLPFETMHVSDFDRKEFLQLLADDAMAHLRSLKDEALFKVVLNRKTMPDSNTVAYLRRLKLVKDMLESLARAGDPQVAATLQPYYAQLEK